VGILSEDLEHRITQKGWWFRLFLVLAIIGSYVLAFGVPDLGDESGIVLCPSRLLTDTRCPSCGFTRSWFAIAAGDYPAALHLNVLSFLFFGVGLALIPVLIGELATQRDVVERTLRRHRRPVYAVVAMLVVIRYAVLFWLEW